MVEPQACKIFRVYRFSLLEPEGVPLGDTLDRGELVAADCETTTGVFVDDGGPDTDLIRKGSFTGEGVG